MNFKIILFYIGIIISKMGYSQENILHLKELVADSLEYKVYWTDSEKQVLEEIYYAKGGVKKSERFELDGQLNGTVRNWYPNGKLQSLENYVYGISAGIWFYFYSDGRIREQQKYVFYKNDIFLGICSDTSVVQIPVTPDSSKMTIDTVVIASSCKKPEYVFSYYQNGKKKSEEYYSDNKKNGRWKYYSELGKLLGEKESSIYFQ
jgi:antitoxin component YwqK of YwqJK toxin-antitoxin module